MVSPAEVPSFRLATETGRHATLNSLYCRLLAASSVPLILGASVAAFGDAEYLFNRGDTLEHLADTVVVKRCHACFYCRLADFLRGGALEGHLTDFGRHGHQLENAQATPIAA